MGDELTARSAVERKSGSIRGGGWGTSRGVPGLGGIDHWRGIDAVRDGSDAARGPSRSLRLAARGRPATEPCATRHAPTPGSPAAILRCSVQSVDERTGEAEYLASLSGHSCGENMINRGDPEPSMNQCTTMRNCGNCVLHARCRKPNLAFGLTTTSSRVTSTSMRSEIPSVVGLLVLVGCGDAAAVANTL